MVRWLWRNGKGEEGYRAHLMYLCEFSTESYVLNLCLQAFLIAFERAIKNGERYSGCRETGRGRKATGSFDVSL